MKKAWGTVHGTVVTSERLAGSLRTGDEVVGWLLGMLDSAISRFHSAQKTSPAKRRASLERVVRAGEALQKLVEDEPEARTIFDAAPADAIGLRIIRERVANGEQSNEWEYCFPGLLLKDRDASDPISARDEDPVPHWRSWSTVDKYRLLVEIANELSLDSILTLALGRVADAANTEPLIAHPGRPDEGFLPYIIRELSGFMRVLYDKPLDETVALLASAVANLPEPLTRDGVRPYRRSSGKNSSGDAAKSSHGKKSPETG
ncbi:MAG: hypothetical protein ACREYA_22995 [Cupriavidus necator]